jgi:predicted nuclease with RNAse H fold
MAVVGLDLAGVETSPTGFCFLKELRTKTFHVYRDEEIVHRIEEIRPQVVAVDAPLSLPAGRKSIEERTSNHLRDCDKELLRRKIRFFPVTLGPMRKLTSRGIKLKKDFEGKRFQMIEVYPGGAQDVLGIPRKQSGIRNLKEGLEKLKIKGLTDQMSHHELDAVTCAYVGKLFLEGKSIAYGTPEQAIIMPKG